MQEKEKKEGYNKKVINVEVTTVATKGGLKSPKKIMNTSVTVVKRFTEGLAAKIKNGHYSNLISEERKNVCNGCENKITVVGVDRCSACGCILDLKTRLFDQECPIGKWPAVKEAEYINQKRLIGE